MSRELSLQGKCLMQNLAAKVPADYRGVILALVASSLFVLVGVLVRVLTETIDAFQVLLFRQIIFICLLLPAIRTNWQLLLKPQKVGLHILRIIGAFSALYLGFITISNIPLADATAIGFSSVLFVALLSRLFLTETITFMRAITLLVGFLGVLLVVQPDFGAAQFSYILLGLGGALGASVTTICIKKIIKVEPKITLLVYQALFVGLLALVPSILAWQWPALTELYLLLLVGGISSLAQWIGVTAYKYGEANVIANVEYSKIIYSLIFGYFLFNEMPNSIALIGVVLVMLSAFLPQLNKRLKTHDGCR